MVNTKTAILLLNVGTPDKPTKGAVRKYLFQFLNDRRVIDLPLIPQKLLVNLFIVPFRAPKSTKLYQELWTEKGSPLLHYSKQLQNKLEAQIKTDVFLAMRYQNPSVKKAIATIKEKGYSKIVCVPLFPHYASSTTETAIQKVKQELHKAKVDVETIFVDQFYNHPAFLNAFVQKIKNYKPEEYDHLLFSYHGLPNRQIKKIHPDISITDCACETSMPIHGKHCYKATCHETTRQLARILGLKKDTFTTSFQSRLSNNWTSPFTDKTIIELAQSGTKKLLVTAPSFVTDCLETTVEIGNYFNKLFIENGGEKLTLVESLNTDDSWVNALTEIIPITFQCEP